MHKGALREYTILGISEVFKKIVSKDFENFFGGKTVQDIIMVVRNGSFYHFQSEEDVQAIAESFLHKVIKEKIDLNELYRDFDKQVTELEQIYKLSDKEISARIIERFFSIYSNLIKVAYASAYSLDFIETLPKEMQGGCKEWIEKSRLRGENIYKYGEREFIPRLSKWLLERVKEDYTIESLQYLFSDELLSWLQKKRSLPDNKLLEERKKLVYARFYPHEKKDVSIGKEASTMINKKRLFEEIDREVKEVDEIKGQSAFKGIVRGKARIIMKRADMSKFIGGEIIVSPMTDPSYLPIMKKAIAFITDEGGTLCHAAIVARELKKPCVIGTKIATKVIHDGDIVEVDAGKGTVKILKKVS